MNYSTIVVTALLMISSSKKERDSSDKGTILKMEYADIFLANKLQASLFNSISCNIENETLDFVTNKEIEYLQIFNSNNQLEFQLVVGSNKVRLSKNILKEGVYKLGFMVKAHKSIEFVGIRVH
jgi:hypothetical protein